MNKFIVYYEDGTQFSGNPLKHDWYKIDETLKIIKFEYFFGKIGIVMEGFRQYNHLLEYHELGGKKLRRILLMGRTHDQTDIIVLDLKFNKVYKEVKPIYREYGKQILNGWQKGMLTTPQIKFKNLK